jgi:hypothetical protein
VADAEGIVFAGQRFGLDAATVLIGPDDPGGFSFARAATPEATLGTDREGQVQRAILRASWTHDAAAAFRVQVGRIPASSAHFIIDFDGTIYQTADLADALLSEREEPRRSVEIVLVGKIDNLLKRPDRPMFPPTHRRAAEMAKHPRQRSGIKAINGHRSQSWGYTDAQYRALGSLLRRLQAL